MMLLVTGAEGGVGFDVVQDRNQHLLPILRVDQLDLGRRERKGVRGEGSLVGKAGSSAHNEK